MFRPFSGWVLAKFLGKSAFSTLATLAHPPTYMQKARFSIAIIALFFKPALALNRILGLNCGYPMLALRPAPETDSGTNYATG